VKIHFMKEDALIYFKGNVDIFKEYYLSKDNNWLTEKYQSYKKTDDLPFMEFRTEVEEFRLDMSKEEPAAGDYNNVKILYTALRGLSDTQAADERLWVGLAHSDLWEYMQYRCKFDESNFKTNKILSNFFFNYRNRVSLVMQYIARLWWVGRLTYDEKANDPYHALDFLKNNFVGKVNFIFKNNFMNNPTVARAVLSAMWELSLMDIKFSNKDFAELVKYVNLLGGIIILDYLSEEELKEKIIKHYTATATRVFSS